jgi:acyl-CoA reductase-like NAD-dependent aldehyde dehydrogenase
MTVAVQTTISPYTQQPHCQRDLESQEEVSEIISKSRTAYSSWRGVSIDDRIGICTRWLEILGHQIPEITPDLALQMGR